MLTLALVAAQLVHFVAREASLRAFSVQVRIPYLALPAAGAWPPLGFMHCLQLLGTAGSVVFDDCALAQIVSRMPSDRTRPFALGLAWQTFVSLPVGGSVLNADIGARGASCTGTRVARAPSANG